MIKNTVCALQISLRINKNDVFFKKETAPIRYYTSATPSCYPASRNHSCTFCLESSLCRDSPWMDQQSAQSFTDGFLHSAPHTACSHCSECRCSTSSYEQTIFHCTCVLHCASAAAYWRGLTHRFHCRATMNSHFIAIHTREEEGREKFPPQRAHHCARCEMDWASHSPQHHTVGAMGSRNGTLVWQEEHAHPTGSTSQFSALSSD